jgi:hypothetical protein
MKLPIWLLGVGLLAAGCRTGTLPDPNDPHDVVAQKPEVLRRNLNSASDMLNQRKDRGEITDEEYHNRLKQYAQGLLKENDVKQIPAEQAYLYAEVLLTAEQWEKAKAVLQEAVKYALESKNQDRRVNDSLRLARVEAELGHIPEAVEITRTTFSAGVLDKAPILPAVLYEIVPAAKSHLGKDGAIVADLLRDAIKQHEEVLVDEKLEAGRAFLIARPHHIRVAWEEAARLYSTAGKQDDARQAAAMSERVGRSAGSV